jgi:methylated-DNA-[protein]-cysteine S-methyltransferase
MIRLQLTEYVAPEFSLLIVTDDREALRALEFADHADRMHRLLRSQYGRVELRSGPAPAAIRKALDAYFDGDYGAVNRIRVTTGGTPFQKSVWEALRSIPAGSTVSYGAIAARIGRASAARAVGAANGANPVSIVVPCHRVIGSSGALTGYGGGVSRKQWLLDHETRFRVRQQST